MTTTVEKQITVDVPVNVAYNQWTQFEEFPQFMSGVSSVTQQDDDKVHWVARIAGVRREWDARILEQVPDQKVAWAATEGATNAGAVYFQSLGPARTEVRLVLEFEPEGLVEKAGDGLGLVGHRAEGDLERFKSFIEDEQHPTGAWRGQVNPGTRVGTPDLADADASRGDSGKAGVSPAAVAAGAGAVAAGAAAAAAVQKKTAERSATVTGRDVVDVLTADHRQVTSLLQQIGTETEPGRRRERADLLIAELVRHSVAEEMHVYPALRKHLPDGEAAVAHDIEEHKELESLLKELEDADASRPEFGDVLARLSITLADHVDDEESGQFPALRARVPEAELVEMGAKVEKAKAAAPTRPHPSAPNSKLFHTLAGPGVGFVDRLRDRLSGRSADA